MTGQTYIETFDNGPGGWLGWDSIAAGPKRLEIQDGAILSRSPWWIDYNHAPPGGGYLHLPFYLPTNSLHGDFRQNRELGGDNLFIEGGFPRDFINAKMTLRLKGEMELRGADLLLLVQSKVGDIHVNHVLTKQPFKVTSDWSEQTIILAPDQRQWKCLGSRHDRMDFYGWGEIADVLRDINDDIILVFYPLDVVSASPLNGDMHRLKAGEDYEVERSRLPAGCLMLDEVRIEFAGT